MTRQQTALRRLTAGLGALALALVGVVATTTAASAAEPGNINPDAQGTIIIHKHVADEDSTDHNPAGAPLDGVTFRVTEVLLDEASVPLATMEGWEAIEGLTPGGVPGGDFTLGASQNVVTGSGGTPGVATTTSLGLGLYLVEEVGSGPNLITAPAAPFLVTIPHPAESGWLYNVDVYPKNVLGDVTPTKTVGTPDVSADIELGAIVPFTISVPVGQSDLPYVSLTIEDALSPGLTFDSWGAISVGATALETGDYEISADNTTVTLLAPGLAKLNALTAAGDTTVTAIISAEVTDLGQLENEATVTINGEPGTTPPVLTNWAQLDILKVDEANDESFLSGATFELYAADQTTLLATGTTNGVGELSFVVWVGNDGDISEVVYLKETVAPAGYVLPADPWFGPYTLTAGETAEASITSDTIENFMPEGVELPLTGAQGTMMMTFGGLFIIAAGASMLLLRRRSHTATSDE